MSEPLSPYKRIQGLIAQTKRADDAEARVQRLREALWADRKADDVSDALAWGTPVSPEFACDTMPSDWDDGTAALAEKDGGE